MKQLSTIFQLFKQKFLTKETLEKPVRVFWWLEFICNLNCNHCDIGAKTNLKNFHPALDLKSKKIVIDKLVEWLGNDFSLNILAGEPFLHPEMFKLINYAHLKKIKTSLNSNATLIFTPAQARKVIKSGLTYLSLSLDSYSAKIHDQTRGRDGVRDQVFKAVENLKLAKNEIGSKTPQIYINTIIMNDNLHELEKIVKWVKKIGVDGITFQPIANPAMFSVDNQYGQNWFKHSPLWPKNDEVSAVLSKLIKLKNDGYPIKNSFDDFEKFEKYFSNPIEFAQGPGNKNELKSMSITNEGYVKMCPSLENSFGHILEDDLDQMWHSKEARLARKHILECTSQCKILANNKNDFYF